MKNSNDQNKTEAQVEEVSPAATDIRPVDFSTGSDIVIRIENLWKEYRLGTINHGTLSQDLNSWWAKLRGKEDSNTKLGSTVQQINDSTGAAPDRFWALRDISVDVKQGEILGIIGKNGAGKSTLLKILSQVTAPTKGQINIRGRVASLLEVGTGFHPELTGRENVFLNGAILGMSKMEIHSKFDEIVAFAEIERFIDTPVKRYSSGMYVRLAFAVAAHLEPEILIVDEVLAVGDAQFQKKCLGKMEEAGKEGRTVLFVSHNMAAVQNLCCKGIVLHNGQVQFIGSQMEAISTYLACETLQSTSLDARIDRQGSGDVRVQSISFVNSAGDEIDSAVSGQELGIRLYFKKYGSLSYARTVASISIKTQLQSPVFLLHNRMTGDSFGALPEQGFLELRIPRLPIAPSVYRVGFSLIQDGAYLDAIGDAAELSVAEGDFFGTGEVPPVSHGLCLVDGHWSLNLTQNADL